MGSRRCFRMFVTCISYIIDHFISRRVNISVFRICIKSKKPFSKKYNHRKSCCSLYSRFSLQFYIIFPRDFYIFYFYYNHMHSEMFDISNNSTRYRFHFYDKSRFVLTMELFDSLFLYFYFNTSRQHYTNFFYFKINFLQQSFMTQLYINWGIFKGR